MKIFELLLYIAYKIFILFAGFILLFSIAIIAVLDSWYYLLLYIPLLLYHYGSSAIDYRTKRRPAFAKEKRLRR